MFAEAECGQLDIAQYGKQQKYDYGNIISEGRQNVPIKQGYYASGVSAGWAI